MNLSRRLKRISTAWSRHHRSAGFGIHSPHAFRFVLDVLRERLPYYAYADLEQLREGVKQNLKTAGRHERIISYKNAKMLFRITNHFNPQHIMQVGTSYGVSTASMLSVNSTTRLTLYEPHLQRYPVVAQVLRPFLDVIDVYDALPEAVAHYEHCLASGEQRFVLVNDLPCDSDLPVALEWFKTVLSGDAVVVMRNLNRPAMRQLWDECLGDMKHGQSFTNDRLGVIVANAKLQREDFELWF